MSLVGFKARNHQQQLVTRGPRPAVDDRATDPLVFAELDARFRFTVDAAASPQNAKLSRYWTIDDDGLEPWLEKAWASRAALVVLLLPANRTEQGWWQRHIEPYRDRGGVYRLTVEFLPGRMRFIAPGAERIGPNERPPFGCCLAIFRRPEAITTADPVSHQGAATCPAPSPQSPSP